MSQEVYVVTEGTYSDYNIVEVFLDEDLANLYVERYNKLDSGGDARVESYDVEHAVDEVVPKLEVRYPGWVEYRAVQEPTYREGWVWAKDAKPITDAHSNRYGVWVAGCDFERVKKAFSERLVQWKAELSSGLHSTQ